MKFSYRNELVTLLAGVAAIASCLFILYRRSHYATRTGPAIADVFFKYGTAQDRPMGRFTWTDLSTGGSLSDGDTVRTSERSRASVRFREGTAFELGEVSMVNIRLGQTPQIDLRSGSIRVDGSADITIEGRQIETRNGSIDLRTGNGIVEAFVRSGNPVIKAGGGVNNMAPGDQLRIEGGSIVRHKSPILTVLPKPGARLQEGDVEFQWTSCEEECTLELSRSDTFGNTRRVPARGQSATVRIERGLHNWRIVSASGAVSQPASFIAIPTQTLTLSYPSAGSSVFAENGRSNVQFGWRGSDLADHYSLEISDTTDFSRNLKRFQGRWAERSVSLPVGTYHWRVTADGAALPARLISETASFSVAKPDGTMIMAVHRETPRRPEPPAPLIIPVFPSSGSVVDMSDLSVLPFRWGAAPPPEGYLFALMSENGNELISTETALSAVDFRDLRKLNVGRFSYKIQPFHGAGSQRRLGAAVHVPFTIALMKRPGAPRPKTSTQ